MTINQINLILNTLKQTDKDLTELSAWDNIFAITLKSNRAIYPSENKKIIFDNAHELLLEYEKHGNTHYLSTIYPYDAIFDITAVNINHKKKSYKAV